MKTKTNSREKLTLIFVCSIMMIFSSAFTNPIQAQGTSRSQYPSSWQNMLTLEDTLYSSISTDYNNDETGIRQDKKAFGHNLQMIITLLREPFISKRSRKDGPYDVIIVPGIPFDTEKNAGMIMKARVKWANYLVSQGIAKNIIFSGSAVYTPYTESRIMAMYAIASGVPAEHIYCETKAEHSTENVVYSLRMAKKLGFEKIAIATGPFQSAFLDKYIKDHSLQVSFIAIPLIYNGKVDPDIFTSIDPSTAFVEDFISLKDRESKEERYQGMLGNKMED